MKDVLKIYVILSSLPALLSIALWQVRSMRLLLLYNVIYFVTDLFIIYITGYAQNNHFVFATGISLLNICLFLYYGNVLKERSVYLLNGMLTAGTLSLYLYYQLWRPDTVIQPHIMSTFYFMQAIGSLWFVWRIIVSGNNEVKKLHLWMGACILCFAILLALLEGPSFQDVFSRYTHHQLLIINIVVNYSFQIIKALILLKAIKHIMRG